MFTEQIYNQLFHIRKGKSKQASQGCQLHPMYLMQIWMRKNSKGKRETFNVKSETSWKKKQKNSSSGKTDGPSYENGKCGFHGRWLILCWELETMINEHSRSWTHSYQKIALKNCCGSPRKRQWNMQRTTWEQCNGIQLWFAGVLLFRPATYRSIQDSTLIILPYQNMPNDCIHYYTDLQPGFHGDLLVWLI